MAGGYFDTVESGSQVVIFTGSPKEVEKFLVRRVPAPDWSVIRGRDSERIEIDAYLAAAQERRITSDKFEQVHQIVMRALQAQAKATFYSDDDGGMDVFALQASQEIVKIFE